MPTIDTVALDEAVRRNPDILRKARYWWLHERRFLALLDSMRGQITAECRGIVDERAKVGRR